MPTMVLRAAQQNVERLPEQLQATPPRTPDLNAHLSAIAPVTAPLQARAKARAAQAVAGTATAVPSQALAAMIARGSSQPSAANAQGIGSNARAHLQGALVAIVAATPSQAPATPPQARSNARSATPSQAPATPPQARSNARSSAAPAQASSNAQSSAAPPLAGSATTVTAAVSSQAVRPRGPAGPADPGAVVTPQPQTSNRQGAMSEEDAPEADASTAEAWSPALPPSPPARASAHASAVATVSRVVETSASASAAPAADQAAVQVDGAAPALEAHAVQNAADASVAGVSQQGVLPPNATAAAMEADPMLPCRILLHIIEGSAGCLACIVLLAASKNWDSIRGWWFCVLCMMGIALAKAGFSLHMACRLMLLGNNPRFAAAAARGDLSAHAQTVQAMWKRSVCLFPALSMTLGGCYLLSGCFSVIQAANGEIGVEGGYGLLLFLYLTLFLFSTLLFLESYTAPKRLSSMSATTAAQQKVELPPPPPNGRIRTGRYGKLMPHAAAADVGSSFNTCSICLDCFVEDDDAARLPCGHIFHSDCLREWLRVRLQCPFRCAVQLSGQPPNFGPPPRETSRSRRAQLEQERNGQDYRDVYVPAREANWRPASTRLSWDPDV